ncbi:DUF2784 domain-containing protein [Aquabacterium sp. A7-Y]|uniref:DUF2784 domain-containing protein n=1 Tax=Aquabacterium sp. A7-Y TaxID=1349605 RepID=UPI00223D4483|nr:DUF2784 domain-containing protein [Aquabacterium sp. A7-Y]MCW7541547.1 DUF2784 domain-containing protein [Aquabacterium sp. A7-Y]
MSTLPPSLYAGAAAAVVLLHLAFIAFAVVGAGLLWRWPRLVWIHLPAVLWAAYVELWGQGCPLTPLENRLRRLGGGQGYGSDFIEHYLLPLIYPAALTRELQIVLGVTVALINLGLYAAWLFTRRHGRH